MTDISIRLAELQDERKRLDALLDDAVVQFALVEEDMNVRMKAATPAELQELMAERARIEDALGIAQLVDRIDDIRGLIAQLQAAALAAA
ncbi:MAG: hypothetical protein ACM31D_20420 [Bacteroidota bacterium]